MSQGLADWKSYVDFVSNIVIAGLAKVAAVSLGYMCEQLDAGVMARESRSPLLEIDLDLYAAGVCCVCCRVGGRALTVGLLWTWCVMCARYAGKTVMFIPAVENTAKADGLRDQVANWIDSILRVATLFHRLDDPSGVYLRDIHQAPEVQVRVPAGAR